MVAARIIYVDAAATGANDGSSWDDAYTSLQSALGAATAGHQIWVAAGVYRPQGARTDSFLMKDGVAVFGGFAVGETALGERDAAANVTVLSGDIGVPLKAIDNSFHVVAAGALGVDAVLDGFTIRDGFANGGLGYDRGGGIAVFDSGSPTLANLLVADNYAIAVGGGLYAESGTPGITNVTFRANTSGGYGGGFYNSTGNPSARDVSFYDNYAAQRGGGMYNETGNPLLEDATFGGNTALSGGGFYNKGGSPTISRARFAGNMAQIAGGGLAHVGGAELTLTEAVFTANAAGAAGGGAWIGAGKSTISAATFAANVAGYGGGVYNGTGDATMTNVTFTRNRASRGGGLWNESGLGTISFATFTRNRAATDGGAMVNVTGQPTLANSILWGNAPDQVYDDPALNGTQFSHNILQGGCPADTACAPGNQVDKAPLLAPLAEHGGFVPTHAIPFNSPAVDEGDLEACKPHTDARGAARTVDGDKNGSAVCDLGAYEFVPAPPAVAFEFDDTGGAEKVTEVNLAVSLSTTAIVPVSVKYAATGGTATGGKDFALSSGILTFAPGTTTKNIPLAVMNDALDEPNETVVVTLSAPTNATLGARTVHTYTIRDDDPRITCRGRLATVMGTAGNDTIGGTAGPDVIAGLGGDDTIDGRAGDDIVCAGDGDDKVLGGGGNDALDGGTGDDRIEGGAGADLLLGRGGRDRLAGQGSRLDACDGGPGADVLPPNHGCEATAGVP